MVYSWPFIKNLQKDRGMDLVSSQGKPGNYIPIEVFHAQIFHLLFIPELRYYQSNYE